MGSLRLNDKIIVLYLSIYKAPHSAWVFRSTWVRLTPRETAGFEVRERWG